VIVAYTLVVDDFNDGSKPPGVGAVPEEDDAAHLDELPRRRLNVDGCGHGASGRERDHLCRQIR
jgi:hypothetical protein